MLKFGMDDYQPRWLNGYDAVAGEHGRRLGGLVGRPLTGVWLAWDLGEDTWYSDYPALFDFDGEQVEVQHQKFDDLSLTWNTIDPDLPVDRSDFCDLKWRAEPFPQLEGFLGLPLKSVELLEWTDGDMAHGSVDVSFVFADGRATVYNALDENGLNFGPPEAHQLVHGVA
jgi:hypothetical protein